MKYTIFLGVLIVYMARELHLSTTIIYWVKYEKGNEHDSSSILFSTFFKMSENVSSTTYY